MIARSNRSSTDGAGWRWATTVASLPTPSKVSTLSTSMSGGSIERGNTHSSPSAPISHRGHQVVEIDDDPADLGGRDLLLHLLALGHLEPRIRHT